MGSANGSSWQLPFRGANGSAWQRRYYYANGLMLEGDMGVTCERLALRTSLSAAKPHGILVEDAIEQREIGIPGRVSALGRTHPGRASAAVVHDLSVE